MNSREIPEKYPKSSLSGKRVEQICQGWERKCVRTAGSTSKGPMVRAPKGRQRGSPPARWSVPQRGMGRAAPAEIEFGANFGLKIRYLVTTVLMIFVRID